MKASSAGLPALLDYMFTEARSFSQLVSGCAAPGVLFRFALLLHVR